MSPKYCSACPPLAAVRTTAAWDFGSAEAEGFGGMQPVDPLDGTRSLQFLWTVRNPRVACRMAEPVPGKALLYGALALPNR